MRRTQDGQPTLSIEAGIPCLSIWWDEKYLVGPVRSTLHCLIPLTLALRLLWSFDQAQKSSLAGLQVVRMQIITRSGILP